MNLEAPTTTPMLSRFELMPSKSFRQTLRALGSVVGGLACQSHHALSVRKWPLEAAHVAEKTFSARVLPFAAH